MNIQILKWAEINHDNSYIAIRHVLNKYKFLEIMKKKYH